ncbi:MAG: hypothetical protein QOE70_790 [Chthoniobacter sp.]|nr:hypothetical protein [Chthoniobacter sp.]
MIEQLDLADYAEQIRSVARATVYCFAAPTPDSEIAPEASKIGGDPDLPAREAWPYFEFNPLPFIAQINLGSIQEVLPTALLPEAGLLSFFRLGQLDVARVLYTRPATKLERVTYPSGDAIERWDPIRSAVLSLVPGISLPSDPDPTWELGDTEMDQYGDLTGELNPQGAWHRVLGHSSFESGEQGELLLFECGSDQRIGTMWGDCGYLSFRIRAEDLARGQWVNAWCDFSCS